MMKPTGEAASRDGVWKGLVKMRESEWTDILLIGKHRIGESRNEGSLT